MSRKIKDLCGDYGYHVLKCFNEKINKIAMDFVEKLTGESTCYFEDEFVFDSIDNLKSFVKGSQSYQRTHISVKSLGDYVPNKIMHTCLSPFYDEYHGVDGCVEYSIEFGVGAVSMCPKYPITIYLHFSYIKIDFDSMILEFGEPKNIPKYYDINGKEIMVNDEVIWTHDDIVKLSTNLVKNIKDCVMTLDDGNTLRLTPNEKQENVFVVSCGKHKINWGGFSF